MIYERGYIVGPMRVNWTFPYTGSELIKRCEEIETEVVKQMDASISAEENYERELAEYREQLRKAGVRNWETAKFDPDAGTYRHSNPDARFREKQAKLKKRLMEIQEFKRQLQHDLERDPDRSFKLTIDDIRFFGL